MKGRFQMGGMGTNNINHGDTRGSRFVAAVIRLVVVIAAVAFTLVHKPVEAEAFCAYCSFCTVGGTLYACCKSSAGNHTGGYFCTVSDNGHECYYTNNCEPSLTT
jgi:hypothetical protein